MAMEEETRKLDRERIEERWVHALSHLPDLAARLEAMADGIPRALFEAKSESQEDLTRRILRHRAAMLDYSVATACLEAILFEAGSFDCKPLES